jgi:hypothetical protein
MSESQHSFWMNPWTYTIAGTAIAAIVAGLVVPILTGSSSSPQGPPPTSQSSPTASNSPGPATSASVAVRYQGPIAINSNGVELDALPPTTGGNVYTLYEDAGGRLNTYQGTVAEWTGSSPPTYNQCRNLVLTQGGGSPPQLTTGLEVCVLTADERTAYIRVMRQSANGWEAHVVVWNQ